MATRSRERAPRLLAAILAVILVVGCGPAASISPSPIETATETSSPDPTPTATAPSPAESAAPTPEPTSAPTAAPTAAAGGDELQMVGTFTDDTIDLGTAGIAAFDRGFVAAGSRTGMWASVDGRDWAAITPTGLDADRLVGLVGIPDGRVLAFGYVQTGPLTGDFGSWISVDGRDWAAIDLGFTADFVFLNVASGAKGLVLAGRQPAIPPVEELWHSSDGLSWNRTYHASDDRLLSTVDAGPEGFVAVGQAGVGFAVASGDGIAWFDAQNAAGPLAGVTGLFTVGPIGGDWLAASLPQADTLAIFRSANGLGWTAGPQVTATGALDSHSPNLTGDSHLVFLHAYLEPGVTATTPSVWMSTDGAAWQPTDVRVPDGAIQTASDGTTLVVFAVINVQGGTVVEFWAIDSP
jgi:hypothetical protein